MSLNPNEFPVAKHRHESMLYSQPDINRHKGLDTCTLASLTPLISDIVVLTIERDAKTLDGSKLNFLDKSLSK